MKGWTEIDAVGLLDAKGKTHWAVSAKASSYYGEREAPGRTRLTAVSAADRRIAQLEAEVARLRAELEKLKKALADRGRTTIDRKMGKASFSLSASFR